MAAFMSTIATQLNWGSSYLVEDFYRRFLKKDGSEAHYVNASRLATAFLCVAAAVVAWNLTSVSEGWKDRAGVGGGHRGRVFAALVLVAREMRGAKSPR